MKNKVPYYQLEDEHGGIVKLYFSPEGNHNIIFYDKDGHDYYHTEFKGLLKDAETAVQEYVQGVRVIDY